jgi:hypothetical protein
MTYAVALSLKQFLLVIQLFISAYQLKSRTATLEPFTLPVDGDQPFRLRVAETKEIVSNIL